MHPAATLMVQRKMLRARSAATSSNRINAVLFCDGPIRKLRYKSRCCNATSAGVLQKYLTPATPLPPSAPTT